MRPCGLAPIYTPRPPDRACLSLPLDNLSAFSLTRSCWLSSATTERSRVDSEFACVLACARWQSCICAMSRLASAAALLEVTTQYISEAMFQLLNLRRWLPLLPPRPLFPPPLSFDFHSKCYRFPVFRLCPAVVTACLAGEACRESSRRQRPRAQRAPTGEPAIPFGGADGCVPRVRRRVGEADDVRVGAHSGGERQR